MVISRGRRLSIITCVLGVVIGLPSICWVLGSRMVRSVKSEVAPVRAPGRDLRIVTADGLSLAATYRPGRMANAPAVLLLHGNGASREQPADNAAWLCEQGYATLTIDFRGHGQSAAASHSFGWNESKDARAAFEWLKREQHDAPVAVIGISMGGASALLGGNGPIAADAMVLQAVYSDIRHTIRNRMASMITRVPAILLEPLLSYQSRLRFGVWPSRLSPLDALRHYHGSVLIIGGAEDTFTPPDETRRMYEAAPGRKTFWLAPGVDHEGVSDLSSADYRARVLSFLEQTIGAP
jgi:alpha-beta hydrolase superfamily lysophospholipase